MIERMESEGVLHRLLGDDQVGDADTAYAGHETGVLDVKTVSAVQRTVLNQPA
ncbi:MAG: hypothetical protein IH612_13815 [Desulfofustis sp.]|nr:hypothetical protein [Desulfofustis sp.]